VRDGALHSRRMLPSRRCAQPVIEIRPAHVVDVVGIRGLQRHGQSGKSQKHKHEKPGVSYRETAVSLLSRLAFRVCAFPLSALGHLITATLPFTLFPALSVIR